MSGAEDRKPSCPQPIGFRHNHDLYQIEEDLSFSPPTASTGPVFRFPIVKNRTWGGVDDASPRTTTTTGKAMADDLGLSCQPPVPPPVPPPPPQPPLPPRSPGAASKQINKMTFAEFRLDLNSRLGGNMKKRRDYSGDSDEEGAGELREFSRKARSLPASRTTTPQTTPHSSPQTSPRLDRRSLDIRSAPIIWQAASEGAVECALYASHADAAVADDRGVVAADAGSASASSSRRPWFGMSGFAQGAPAHAAERGETAGLAGRLERELRLMNKPFIHHRRHGGVVPTDGFCAVKRKDLNLFAPTST